ncbi:MAG: polyamine ABC transporter substrate-binding protein [Burkholderiaceae bacterium]|nr:polyamine ABC transporter substrate-binding protein [Burkholderiaceae bacterium]
MPNIKRIAGLFGIIACILLLGSCSKSAEEKAEEENVLNVYNWSDYIGENTIADFEKETGIKVRYDTFDANETLHAKLLARHTGYDIVVPSSHWAKMQLEGGLFRPLDKSRIVNWKNLDPAVMRNLATLDPGNTYLAPWLWGTTTLGINVDKVKAALGDLPMPDNAWDLLFKPQYASRLKSCGVSVLDSGDELFPAALRYLGHPPFSKNPADYQDAAKLLNATRPSVTLFSSSGYINDLAAGSLCLSMGFNGDIGIAAQRAKEANNGQHVEILLPKSGAVLFFDTMAIPADAEHVENAYKWINYIYRPEVQAGLVNKVFYANPVRAADPLIKPEVRDNKAVFLEGDVLSRMVPPDSVSNDIRRLRTRLFTTFKTGL